MLTLFPRIRPNPPACPPLPLPETPDSKPRSTPAALDAVPLIAKPAEAPAKIAASVGDLSVSSESAPAETAAATSVSDSDLLAAFLSGLATAGAEPFVVEIGAHSAAVERKQDRALADMGDSGPAAVPAAAPVGGSAEPAETAARAAEAKMATPQSEQQNQGLNEAAGQESVTLGSPQLFFAAANIFDELDVFHEAAAESTVASAGQAEAECSSTAAFGVAVKSEPQPEENREKSNGIADTGASIAGSAPIKTGVGDAQIARAAETAMPPTESANTANTDAVSADGASQDVAASKRETANAVEEGARGGTASAQTSKNEKAGAKRDEAAGKNPKRSGYGSAPRPPKPRRAKGTLFGLARVPEPEAMDDSGEVEAYASAAAQAHLDAIDDTFVAHAQLLLNGRERGRALDIGTGPGQIVIKLGYRLTRWKFTGIDRSATMIEKAQEALATAGELAGRIEFRVADGSALDFPGKTFDMVVCNSVLHHIREPQKLFAEIARVVKPGGAILLRDLRRPSRWGYRLHVWKNGRHYSGEMRRLFDASVQAAYTEDELRSMVAASALRGVRVFRHGKTHIGFERAIESPDRRRK